jgi:hypothetical protein
VLASSWHLLVGSALAVLPIAVTFETGMAYLELFIRARAPQNEYIALVVNGLVGLAVYGAVMHLVLQRLHGRTLSIPAAFKNGLVQWLTMLAAGFVSQIVILITCLLLIVPGLYFIASYALIGPLIMGEDVGWYEALQQSRERMTGHRIKLGLLFVPLYIGSQALGLVWAADAGFEIVPRVAVFALVNVFCFAAVPAAMYAAVTPREAWKLKS